MCRAAPGVRIPRQARATPIISTVLQVLKLGDGEPMKLKDLHSAAEAVLGLPIPKSSAYEALATHARTKDRRFQRVGYGLYEYRHER